MPVTLLTRRDFDDARRLNYIDVTRDAYQYQYQLITIPVFLVTMLGKRYVSILMILSVRIVCKWIMVPRSPYFRNLASCNVPEIANIDKDYFIDANITQNDRERNVTRMKCASKRKEDVSSIYCNQKDLYCQYLYYHRQSEPSSSILMISLGPSRTNVLLTDQFLFIFNVSRRDSQLSNARK